MTVSVGGVVVERTGSRRRAPCRLIDDLELNDKQGNLPRHAPRAPRSGIDEDALFSGQVVPTSIKLIGPRIRVCAISRAASSWASTSRRPKTMSVTIDAGDSRQVRPAARRRAPPPRTPRLTARAPPSSTSSAAAPTDGRHQLDRDHPHRRCQIRFYDEANDAIWNIRTAELVFPRMPYGFTVDANASVSNGDEDGRLEGRPLRQLPPRHATASRSAPMSTISSPANISDEIFAFSQLARVKVPLAGPGRDGGDGHRPHHPASGEFIAVGGRGRTCRTISPSRSIVDEGSLRADYDPGHRQHRHHRLRRCSSAARAPR